MIGGSGRNRTGVRGVAVHYMTTLPPSLIGVGAGNRVRTGELNLGKVALYQLSYSRTQQSRKSPRLWVTLLYARHLYSQANSNENPATN